MKKTICLVLCLLVLASLLGACQKDGADSKTYTYENVSMTVPGAFKDMSEEASGDIYDFVVGTQKNLVLANKKEDFGVADYMNAVVGSLEITEGPDDRNGYVYLQYKNSAQGYDYIYNVGLFIDGEDLWIVQVSSLENEYSKNKTMMFEILDSVKVK